MEHRRSQEPAPEASAACPHDPGRSLDVAAIGIAHVSPEGAVTYANARLCELLGYAPSEIIGRTTADLTYPADVDLEVSVRQALVRGSIVSKTDEKRLLRKDGRVIWVKRWLSLARDAACRPLYIVAAYDDITESKLTAERYRAIFDNAAVGITQVRLDGLLVDVNDKFCEMLGYSRAELCGKSIRDITHPEDYGTGASFRERIMDG